MPVPATTDPPAQMIYEIRVKGCLEGSWSEWFEGLDVTLEPGGEMRLAGPLADQAALYGVLFKIRDLGLPLLAVNRITRAADEGKERSCGE